MTWLPDFRLEARFSQWEFTARYNLTASHAQTMTLSDLLALADDEDRAAFESLSLGYTTTHGDPALREVIAQTYQQVDAADVICFAGAEEGLFVAMNVLLGAGDHAVVVTPNYQSAETVPLSRCAVTGVALDPGNDWALDVGQVKAAIRPNTKVVSVNFPNNPTGTVISAAALTELAHMCDEHGIHLFCDEIFRGLEREPARTLPQAADLSGRALSLNAVSKPLGLPGLRIGWIACRDRALLARLERAKHYTTICGSAPSEILARIALKARGTILDRNRALIERNLPAFDAFFAEFAGAFDWQPPHGSYFAYPRYLGPEGVEELCTLLLQEAGVLLLPASIFASELTPTPADRFRIGMGLPDAEEGLAAFAQWMREHRTPIGPRRALRSRGIPVPPAHPRDLRCRMSKRRRREPQPAAGPGMCPPARPGGPGLWSGLVRRPGRRRRVDSADARDEHGGAPRGGRWAAARTTRERGSDEHDNASRGLPEGRRAVGDHRARAR